MTHQTRDPEKSTVGAEKSVTVVSVSIDRDLDLARKLSLSHPGALEELIEQHGDHLQRLTRTLAGASSADDLMQEILLKAWEAAGDYRGDAPLRHWLVRIAVRVCRNHQRGYRRWMAHLKSFWQSRLDVSPQDSSVESSDRDELQLAMSKLPYADRELLVLYYFEEQPLSQVAGHLGARESTLHVRLHRSRERLKILLQQAEEESDG